MPTEPLVTIAARRDPSTGSANSGLGNELHLDNCRRLAGLALFYSFAYTLAYGFGLASTFRETGRLDEPTSLVLSLAALLMGWTVFLLARRGRVPRASFPNLASAFMILGSLGIAIGAWNWQFVESERLAAIGNVLGFHGEGLITEFVGPLNAEGHRLLSWDGVPWVGVWILVFPMVVPGSPLRVVVSAFLAVTTAMAVPTLSVLVNGTPPILQNWITPFYIEFWVPALICVGLTYITSRTVYQLARQLSQARRMGSYKLEEKIGFGGMGEVWRARHRMLARPAAIKLIRKETLGDGDAARTTVLRFEKEAQATAELSSPHTVELYDFGVTQDGAFYYVMELLDGFDLKTLVEEHGPVPAARAVHLLEQCCHSLEDAHAAGLIHRDIKPANMFTCRKGVDLDFVKVLDFGLVKESGSPEVRPPDLTQEGLALGTPSFMAPESATGSHPVDHRADLYSLGCVAYWLVTGRLLFEGETPMAVILKHVNDAPLPPSRVSELPIPGDLEELILACLAKSPDQRPGDAAELRRRLIDCRGTCGTWTRDQARSWWQANSPRPLVL